MTLSLYTWRATRTHARVHTRSAALIPPRSPHAPRSYVPDAVNITIGSEGSAAAGLRNFTSLSAVLAEASASRVIGGVVGVDYWGALSPLPVCQAAGAQTPCAGCTARWPCFLSCARAHVAQLSLAHLDPPTPPPTNPPTPSPCLQHLERENADGAALGYDVANIILQRI
jgi:hypothetical protein